jgi:hypothetical protein
VLHCPVQVAHDHGYVFDGADTASISLHELLLPPAFPSG